MHVENPYLNAVGKDYLPDGVGLTYATGEPLALTYIAGEPTSTEEMNEFLVELATSTHRKYINHQLRGSDGLVGQSPIVNPLHNATRALHNRINEQTAEKAAAVALYGTHIAIRDPAGLKPPQRVPLSYATLARFEANDPRPHFTTRVYPMSEAPQPEKPFIKPVSILAALAGTAYLLWTEPGKTIREWAKDKLPKFGAVKTVGAIALSR